MAMATVNQEFESAPMGRMMAGKVTIVVAVLFAAMIANIFIAFRVIPQRSPHTNRAVVALAPLVGLLVVLPVFLVERSRIARFKIEEDCLVLGCKRYPLAGLASVARDPEILRWAFRIVANGGFGAIRGRYWSRRVGKFDAFMTDPEKAVVLRWPDRLVAVSPSDPEFFILCAKSASGLR